MKVKAKNAKFAVLNFATMKTGFHFDQKNPISVHFLDRNPPCGLWQSISGTTDEPWAIEFMRKRLYNKGSCLKN